MSIITALGYIAVAALLAAWLEERMWWLLAGPGPWRWLGRAVAGAWRYLAPASLPGDIRRLLETGRLT